MSDADFLDAPVQVAEAPSPIDDLNRRMPSAQAAPPAPARLAPVDDLNRRMPAPAPLPAPARAASPVDDLNGRMPVPAHDGDFGAAASAFTRGLVTSHRDAARALTGTALQDRPPEADDNPELTQLLQANPFSSRRALMVQIAHGLGSSGPMLEGAAAGTMAGGAIGSAVPVVGTAIGGTVGGALGGAAGAAIQTLAPAYQQARAQGMDPDAATSYALQHAGTQGVIGGAMAALGGLAPVRAIATRMLESSFTRAGLGANRAAFQAAERAGSSGAVTTGDLAAQTLAIQPAVALAGQAAETGYDQGRLPTADEFAQGYVGAAGPGAVIAGAHLLPRLVRGAPEPQPQAPRPPGPPPAGEIPPGAPEPLQMPMRAEPISVDPSRPAEPPPPAAPPVPARTAAPPPEVPPAEPPPTPSQAEQVAADLRSVLRVGQPAEAPRPTPQVEGLRAGLEAIMRGEEPAASRADAAPPVEPAAPPRIRYDLGNGYSAEFEPTPEADQQAQRLASGVEAIIAAKAPVGGVRARFVSDIVNNQTGARAYGLYDPARRVIWTALRAVDEGGRFRTADEIGGTIDHDLIHFLKDRGAFRPNEWAALERAANERWVTPEIRERWRGHPQAVITEEAIAEAAREFAAGNRQKVRATGPTLGALNRIKEIVGGIASWARGHGFTTPEMVLRRVESGAVGRRMAQQGQVQPALAQAAPRQPVFFSALTRAAEQAKLTRGTPEQWLNTIRNTPGVKGEELAWSGIEDWLRGRQGTVTRDEVANFLRENEVKVEEVTKGVDTSVSERLGDEHQAAMEKFYAQREREMLPGHVPGPMTAESNRLWDIAQEIGARLNEATAPEPTKFGQYTLPGGENYRELLLTMPGDRVSEAQSARMTELERRLQNAGDYDQHEIDAYRREYKALADKLRASNAFTGGHYDEPNVLAHVRFNDRTDAQGKRTLFIEEVQSDWHQKGRKQGYQGADEGRRRDLMAEDASLDAAIERGNAPNATEADLRAKEQAVARRLALYDELNRIHDVARDGVPDAPFKQSWHELAMKRMLRYAAENGYDKIAWTTGEQQAARYDLSKQISEIHYSGSTLKAYDLNGRPVIERTGVRPEDLPDIIGKEPADKLMAQEPRGTLRSLTGQDLKVGGEGMRGFYDRILPAFLNKYAKKWGARVGETNVTGETAEHGPLRVASDGNRYWLASDTHGMVGQRYFDSAAAAMDARDRMKTGPAVHSIDVTPAMREGVMQGQPMAMAAPSPPLPPPPGPAGPAPTLPEPGRFNTRIGERLSRATPAVLREVMHDVLMKIAPMSQGNVPTRAAARDFITGDRQAHAQLERAWRDWTQRFTPDRLRAIWEAINRAHEDFAAGRNTTGDALNALPPPERAAASQMLAYSADLWKRAQDAGVVTGDAPSPFYATRALGVIGSDGSIGKLPQGQAEQAHGLDAIGRNLTTKGTFERKYDTAAETEAAARAKFESPDVGIVRDIRANLLAFHRMERAIAGKNLIRAVKEYGDMLGVPSISTSEQPGFFTLDHPAFKQWRPRFETDAAGKTTAATDANGDPIFDRTPIYVSRDWEGPLRAVLAAPTGRFYNALMAMKSGATSMIMFSPFMHLMVEVGRTFPTMPGKMITGRLFFDGNKARSDPALANQAIGEGLSPINRRGFVQDITAASPEPQFGAGRSMVARALGSVGEALMPGAGEKIRSGIDAAGKFWHETLLWDRVADLQFGIWKNIREDMIAKGFAPRVAGETAAHLANRYAGAMPTEAMSQMAAKIGNVVAFSRSFTAGNLGVFKDAVRGMPRDVLSRIQRDAGTLDAKAAQSYARRKAIGALAVDMALTLGMGALIQNAFQVVAGQSLGDVADGYTRRLRELASRAVDHPMSMLMHPFDTLQAPFPQSENEPGKQDRVHVGNDSLGRAVYMRNPITKIGEEFMGWLTRPREMLLNKESTLIRPFTQLAQNDRGFARRVYNPNDNTFQIIGDIALNFLRQQIPEGQITAMRDFAAGRGDPGVAAMRTFGPVAGLSFSQGHPGGPAMGFVSTQERDRQARIVDEMPTINRMIRDGQTNDAAARMQALGFNGSQIASHIRNTANPQAASPRRMQTFMRTATPEQRDQFDRARN